MVSWLWKKMLPGHEYFLFARGFIFVELFKQLSKIAHKDDKKAKKRLKSMNLDFVTIFPEKLNPYEI